VDFGSFKSIVNTLGGVEINLTAEEAEYMNTYILDGIQYEPGSLKPGVNLLNGDQALEYARIRKVGGTGDFGRTDRQRTVLDAIFNKCKTMDLFTALNMVNTLLPYIRTDIPRDSIISLATELFPLLGGQLIQQRVPADGSWSLLDVPMGSYDVEVIVIDFAKTHRFLLDTLMPK
jgi:anionic cell wall polymer biosynthesis LytR-Cps2A-Psr (LCP) family protein